MAKIFAQLDEILADRLLVLDGAMGSMLQRHALDEAAFRGELLRNHKSDVKGDSDLLVLTQPRIVQGVHRAYLDAGADIIETNTFGATRIAQADYHLEHLAYEMNVRGAQIAREVADEVARKSGRPRFVAGSIGPTNRTLSISPKVSDPAFRAVSWAEMVEAYGEQTRGLLDGGADLLLVETIFDTLNAKACLYAIDLELQRRGQKVPVMISVTITDRSGRTLSGQTLEAFWTSIRHSHPWSVGINCALGAREMRPLIEELAGLSDCRISCYPNAGLPNAFGGYDEEPNTTGALIAEFAHQRWVDVVGGCCGTTPEHIAAIAKACNPEKPRPVSMWPHPNPAPSRWAGLEPLVIRPDTSFIVIGERTNVTGSKKFMDLIKASDYQAALQVALDQVRGGANILDVNMDEGMLDSVAAMRTFLNTLAGEPEIARLPVMVDSSKWEVLEAGLRCLQGKGIVNSISLKDGEAAFLEKAHKILRYGAATVVMAFDEEGQATDTERRLQICERAYKLLIGIGFPPEDIIFDPNVLAIGTGLEEHARYALSFIETTRALKQRCPGAKISGGISNLSFAFRGNNPVREAMNSAFLFHAIRAGLDMGIVNAGQIAVYDDIDKQLLELVEDVLFDRRPDSTERLVALADQFKGAGKKKEIEQAWREGTLEQRMAHALIHGLTEHIDGDTAEALAKYGTPLAVIEGPMMAGMSAVGDLFGAGKMFLPQVVKSARVMKKAVAWLEPHLQAQKNAGVATTQGRVLMATVKGDVHDIGKNIVGVVMGCNGYEVVDLGVMVAADTIVNKAMELNVDAVGLSGLITPSLDEMVHVAREMERRGLKIPLLIGGATTSKQHTAVKIAPVYSGAAVHVLDASRAVGTLSSLLSKDQRDGFVAETRADQQRLRELHLLRQAHPLLPFSEVQTKRPQVEFSAQTCVKPQQLGVQHRELELAELVPYIDWTFLFVAWDLKGKFPQILDHPDHGHAARELFDQAQALLQKIVQGKLLQARAVWGLWPAAGDGNDIAYFADEDRHHEAARFCFLRQQQKKTDAAKPHLCLADYVAPVGGSMRDYAGAFAVTAGLGLEAIVDHYRADHDDFHAILAQALADRLAEAAAEWLHQHVRKQWYAPDEPYSPDQLIAEPFGGIRPAFGYPSCPDHTEKTKLWQLLRPQEIGITLTENLAMYPGASVSGLYLGHPQARYFATGPVGGEQILDYARRKGMSVQEVERALESTIAGV